MFSRAKLRALFVLSFFFPRDGSTRQQRRHFNRPSAGSRIHYRKTSEIAKTARARAPPPLVNHRDDQSERRLGAFSPSRADALPSPTGGPPLLARSNSTSPLLPADRALRTAPTPACFRAPFRSSWLTASVARGDEVLKNAAVVFFTCHRRGLKEGRTGKCPRPHDLTRTPPTPSRRRNLVSPRESSFLSSGHLPVRARPPSLFECCPSRRA